MSRHFFPLKAKKKVSDKIGKSIELSVLSEVLYARKIIGIDLEERPTTQGKYTGQQDTPTSTQIHKQERQAIKLNTICHIVNFFFFDK